MSRFAVIKKVNDLSDKQLDYLDVFLTEIVQVINLGIAQEEKHGAGVICKQEDVYKAIGHLEKGVQGVINPDEGSDGSEYRAAGFRIFKTLKHENLNRG